MTTTCNRLGLRAERAHVLRFVDRGGLLRIAPCACNDNAPRRVSLAVSSTPWAPRWCLLMCLASSCAMWAVILAALVHPWGLPRT